MENSYGIGVANRYALFLDDESDPLETLTLKEQEKELKKKTKGAEKENKGKPEAPAKAKPAAQPAQPKKAPKEQKASENKREALKPLLDAKPRANNDDPAKPRNFKFNNNNENREDRNNRRNREDKFIPLENKGERVERPRREGGGGGGADSFESRNKGEGRREGGGPNRDGRAIGNKPGGPRGPRRTFDDRRGKREYDRQSGSDKTGVKPIDKRDGAGSHNWGSNKDIIEDADRPTDNDPVWTESGSGEKPEGTAPEQNKEGVESTEAEPTAVEEEPKELTLDEWKAQRAGRSKPTYNIRKAGEGEDPSQWKKMYELKKRENEQDDDEDDEEYDASEYPQRVGRQKHILDIDIQFNDSRRPGGGRGGRGQRPGGPRGNRGANPRGPRPDDRAERRFRNEEQQPGEDRTENRKAPKVDDHRDFPSLG